MTIEQVAARGVAGASLARIADSAGITKAAVLYYFGSKDALVAAAHMHVLEALVTEVATAVGAVENVDRPATYVRTMIVHLCDHPSHTGMIVAAAMTGEADHQSSERWGPLAGLLSAASRAARADGVASVARADGSTGESLTDTQARTLAVVVGGAIDGIVGEHLEDADFDVEGATELLIELMEPRLR